MLNIKILDREALGQDADLSIFHKFGNVEVFDTTSEAELVERLQNAHIVITNKVPLKGILDSAKELKLICIAATGTNNVDLQKARHLGIAVTNVAGYSTMSVAQHTFAMLFYVYEKLRYFDEYVRSGAYTKSPIFCHFGRTYSELDKKTWGIVGFGAIGRKVAQIAQAFGCEVIYYSTSGLNNATDYKRVEKEELFRKSDIISIHAPLNEKNKNFVTYEELKLMKPTGILLNLGRGGLVNEEDLVRALDENLIAAAGLDVLEAEPMAATSPILKVREKEKLFVTPHIAWASKEARERLLIEISENIEAFLKGEKRNRVEG